MAKILTPAQAAVALKTLGPMIKLRALRPFGKALSAGRKDAIAGYRSRGIGRNIWRKRQRESSKPPLILKRNRVRLSRTGGGFIGGYTAKGMAGLIELGGQTEKHLLRPKKGKYLVFEGRSGTVFWKGGTHPGGPVKANPALHTAMEKVGAVMVPLLDKTIKEVSRLLF